MSILKETLNFEIREAIRKFPKNTNKQIAGLFDGVSPYKVRANRAHVTMGTDTDNPQGRRKGSIASKKLYFGASKISARNKKVNAIIKSEKLSGTILTLCGEGLVVENALYMNGGKEFGYNLVENKREVFNKILLNVATSPLNVSSVNNCLMSEMIHNSHTDQFSHVVFDYCCSLNSVKSEVDMAIKNNIVQVGGTIGMTFSTRGVQPIMVADKVDDECKNLSGAKKYFSRFENYELVENFTYKDGAPMMVLILKRIS